MKEQLPGVKFEPEEADRLIANFGDKPDPEKQRELDEGLRAWKEKFQELQRGHAAQERNPERDR